MLIDRHGMNVVTNEVFADMWPWDVQSWATRRGVAAKVTKYEDGWSLDAIEDSGTLELLLIKAWWRDLGRSAVATAIERLTCEHSSPLWLPEDF